MALRHFATAVAAAALGACGFATTASAGVLAPFQETPVITGLTNPTAVRFAPDGRIFVAEQSGLLKVFNGLGDNTPDVAVDLRTNVMNNWDRGFLGLAIDPQFPAAGHDYVYVLYTVDAPPGQNPPIWNDSCADQTTNGCVTRGRLSRVRIAADNTQIGAEEVLVDDRWCFQFPTHSIGDLRFGPEGALYVSGGEGASFSFIDYGQAGNPCGDPANEGGSLRSQDILTSGDAQTWDGALMRLDVSGASAVPWPSNSRVGVGTPDDDAIIAHGFRNPFRFTIHPGPGAQTGEVWVGDVGLETWEEIDRLSSPSGPLLNFGWPCYEGSSGVSTRQPGFDGADLPLCEGLYAGTIASAITASVYAYQHGSLVIPGEQCGAGAGSSISGLAFYPGGGYPAEYQNALFFEDYTRRCLWAMLPDTPGGVPNPNNRRAIVWNAASGSVDLEVGPGGDLYYAEYTSGQITRLRYFATNTPPTAALQATPSSGPAPLSVAFDASASADADPGDTLTYLWDLDGDGLFDDPPDADPRSAHRTYTQPGPITVSVRVTDSHAASAVASQVVSVANSPPVATILTPPDTTMWRVGDQIFFSGRGDDPDEGPLPPSSLSWELLLHHCTLAFECHVHHLQTLAGVDHGSLVAPDHPYPAYLELQLTAKDSGTGWLNAAWSTRRRIRFNNSTQVTNLVGFQVLVALNSGNVDYGKTQDAGQDLRFTDADGTLLPHQIETWNKAGTSYVWVRVPQIDASSTVDSIFMYYGNPSAPDGQSTAVWDSTYGAVWHLGTSFSDSTSHANNGVNHGSFFAVGQIAGARSFNGSSWIEVASSPSLEISGSLTLEAWIKIANPALNATSRIVDKKAPWDGPQGYDMEYDPLNNRAVTLGSGGNWGSADGVDLDTQWHWLAATISGASARVYVDGVDRTTDPDVSPLAAGTLALNIGRHPTGSYFQGSIDELRVSNVARSVDWMRAQYLSMTGAFTTIGAEEGSTGLSGTTTLSLFPETRDLTFSSSPSGLQLTVGGTSNTTPFNETVITNSLNSISAPSPQSLSGTNQLFVSWSDGGAQSHDFVAGPQLSGVSATFVSASCGNGALDPGEDCDDGNTSGGDCCSALCRFEATGSACSDGNACTANDTCSTGVCSGTLTPDSDGDGLCNANDNCPYVSNPGQADSGGIGSSVPDGIGDVCQCGDLTGEGRVDAADVLAYRQHLANPFGLPFTAAQAGKCSVAGGSPAVCDLLDVDVARRALVGAGPGIAQVCASALPP